MSVGWGTVFANGRCARTVDGSVSNRRSKHDALIKKTITGVIGDAARCSDGTRSNRKLALAATPSPHRMAIGRQGDEHPKGAGTVTDQSLAEFAPGERQMAVWRVNSN